MEKGGTKTKVAIFFMLLLGLISIGSCLAGSKNNNSTLTGVGVVGWIIFTIIGYFLERE